MDEQSFEEIARTLDESGLAAGFETLRAKSLDEKNYPAVFEARLIEKRIELGLPALHSGKLDDSVPDSIREAYETTQIAAAREAGELFLADGQIHRAWPYFRALGDPAPIAAALDQARPGEDDVDPLVEVAYHEGVHPRRGFEMILEHYGICRAITNFSHYPSEEGKLESARLLVDSLYGDLVDGIRRAVESVEDPAPESRNLHELLQGRDWLFEGRNYFIDTSHVASIVQMSVQWDDSEVLRKVVELTEYGRRLDEMYQFKGDPPFENVYEDTGIYVRAILGEDVDDAVAHFRAKVSSEPDPYGNPPAQVFVNFLVRLGRPGEAIDVAAECLEGVDPQFIQCPSALELCQMAGDYERMAELAQKRGDALGYAAALAVLKPADQAK